MIGDKVVASKPFNCQLVMSGYRLHWRVTDAQLDALRLHCSVRSNAMRVTKVEPKRDESATWVVRDGLTGQPISMAEFARRLGLPQQVRMSEVMDPNSWSTPRGDAALAIAPARDDLSQLDGHW